MSRTFPNIGITGGFTTGESNWGDAMNANLLKLSALVQATAVNKVSITPPSPTNPSVYIFDNSHPTNPNKIAIYENATWTYITPQQGWTFYNIASATSEIFTSGVWSTVSGPDLSGVESDITAIENRLTAMASDNILDRTEKYDLVTQYQILQNEKAAILAQATAYGITTEKTNYDNAMTALTSYLIGLSPAYNDTTQDTVIVGTTFRQKITDVYSTRQILLNRMVGIGSTSAYLTNESAVVAADSLGVVSSFASAAGNLVVKTGNNVVSSGVTYSVVSSTNMTISINSSGAFSVTAMSANTATAILRAVYDGQTFDKIFSLAKALAGVQGATGSGTAGPAGSAGISGYLTNEAVSLFAYADGTVTSYSGATGSFKVFSGNTDVSSNFTLTAQSNPNAIVINFTNQTYTVTGGLDPNEDTASVTIRATGSGAYAGTILDKVFWIGKIKGGYEIVSTLPTTNLFIGRVVFLNSDEKLYRYATGGWTSVVPAVDISGQIVAAQIASGAITTAKFASGIEPVGIVTSVPSTKTTNTVFNTTDGKTYRWNGSAYINTVPSADISGQISDAQIAAVSAAKMTGQITSTQITDGSISTPKLAAGSVTAATIAAGSIDVTKLSVFPTNLQPDSQFKLPSLWWQDDESGSSTDGPLGTTTSGWYTEELLNATTSTTVGNRYATLWSSRAGMNNSARYVLYGRADQNNYFNCAPNTIYELKAGCANYSNQGFVLGIIWQNLAGSQISSTGYGWSAGEVSIKGQQVIAPAQAVRGLLVMYNESGSVFSGTIQVGNITIREAAGATLLVDGSITASKIAADTITAGQIAAGAISTTELASNAVTADRIAAGAITTDKLAANSIDAGKIQAGAINAGHIASNSIDANKIQAGAVTAAKMSVTDLGAISATVGLLRTATTGSRLEIESNQIRVYDGSNVLRVRLGIW